MGLFDRIVGAGRAAYDAARGALAANPVARPQKPIATPGPYWDRDPNLLGNALSPARLTTILADRNAGYLQPWVDLLDEFIEHDPHLFNQLSLRAQSVVETDFVVQPGQGSNQRAARRAAAMATELLAAWQAREGDGWETWLHEITWGLYYGRSLHEVLWARDGRLIIVDGLALVDPRRLSLACDPNDPEPWTLRIWDQGAAEQSRFAGAVGTPITAFHRDVFLALEPRVRGSQKTREGLGAVLGWYEVFRTWSWRELMALAEMVSRPPVIGYFSAGGAKADGSVQKANGDRNATTKEVAAARNVVNATTGALRAVLPDTVRLEALKFSLPTTDPVPLLTSRECEALVSKTVNGVANLTDLKAAARAAVETQERTTHTFWRADCRRTARAFNTLFARIVRANPDALGEDCPPPVLHAQVDPPANVDASAKKISVARSAGLPVARRWAYEELEIPEPSPGEELLAPLPAPPTNPPKPDGPPEPTADPPPEPA